MDAELEDYLTTIFNVELYEEIIERGLFDSNINADSFTKNLFTSLEKVKSLKIKPRLAATFINEQAKKYSQGNGSEFYKYILKILCNEYDETLHLPIKAISKYYEMYKEEFGIKEEDFKLVDNYFHKYSEFYLDPVAPGITWVNHTKIGKDPNLFNLLNNTEVEIEGSETIENKNLGNTAKRQALALYYLNLVHKIQPEENKAAMARFAAFLTGKSYDNLLQTFKNPLGHISPESQRKDLMYIREIFKDLKNFKIIDLIDNDLSSI